MYGIDTISGIGSRLHDYLIQDKINKKLEANSKSGSKFYGWEYVESVITRNNVEDKNRNRPGNKALIKNNYPNKDYCYIIYIRYRKRIP